MYWSIHVLPLSELHEAMMNVKEKPSHIKQSDWDDVDIPELTREDFARMRPVSEVLPDIVDAFQQNGGFISITDKV